MVNTTTDDTVQRLRDRNARIVARFMRRDSLEQMASDYGMSKLQIEDVIRQVLLTKVRYAAEYL
jgi:hypothetical protein